MFGNGEELFVGTAAKIYDVRVFFYLLLIDFNYITVFICCTDASDYVAVREDVKGRYALPLFFNMFKKGCIGRGKERAELVNGAAFVMSADKV